MLQAYEYDGTYVMHVSRAKAARALGAKADDIKKVRINIIPALKEIYGWSEDKAVSPLPKNLADLNDDEVLDHVNQLKKDMDIGRELMTKLGSGRSSRDLLGFLLGVKSRGGFTEEERTELLERPTNPDSEIRGGEIDDGFEDDGGTDASTGTSTGTASKVTITTTAVSKPKSKPKSRPKSKPTVKAKVKVKIKPKARKKATASA